MCVCVYVHVFCVPVFVCVCVQYATKKVPRVFETELESPLTLEIEKFVPK